MTIDAKNLTTPASAKTGVGSNAMNLGHGPVQLGTPGKTLPMTPQVKQNIAAVRSAYNAYQRSGGKETIRAWLQPQVEAVLKGRGTTSAQNEKPMDEGIGVGAVLAALADVALDAGGPLGVVAGLLIDTIVDGINDGGDGGGAGGGSGDGSRGDNPGGGGSPA